MIKYWKNLIDKINNNIFANHMTMNYLADKNSTFKTKNEISLEICYQKNYIFGRQMYIHYIIK